MFGSSFTLTVGMRVPATGYGPDALWDGPHVILKHEPSRVQVRSVRRPSAMPVWVDRKALAVVLIQGDEGLDQEVEKNNIQAAGRLLADYEPPKREKYYGKEKKGATKNAEADRSTGTGSVSQDSTAGVTGLRSDLGAGGAQPSPGEERSSAAGAVDRPKPEGTSNVS